MSGPSNTNTPTVNIGASSSDNERKTPPQYRNIRVIGHSPTIKSAPSATRSKSNSENAKCLHPHHSRCFTGVCWSYLCVLTMIQDTCKHYACHFMKTLFIACCWSGVDISFKFKSRSCHYASHNAWLYVKANSTMSVCPMLLWLVGSTNKDPK